MSYFTHSTKEIRQQINRYETLITKQDEMIAWYCDHYSEYRAYPSRVQMMCDSMVIYRTILARYQSMLAEQVRS